MRWTLWSAVVVVLLGLFTSIALLFPVVQTGMARMVSAWLKDTHGVDMRIERVAIKPFGPVRLRGVLVMDLHGDTLIAVDDLRLGGLHFGYRSGQLRARLVQLDHTRFRLVKALGDSTSNLTQLLDRFGSGSTDTSSGLSLITCRQVRVNDLRFTYDDANVQRTTYGVDVDHVNVLRADIAANDFRMEGDSIVTRLEKLAVREGCGFHLERLQGTTTLSGRGLRVEEMVLRTPGTALNGRLAFATENWRAYNDFYHQVNMRLDLDSSRVHFADIAYFATALEGVDMPMDVSGKVRGTVSELRGRGLKLRWGRSSSFEGDADLSGLPDVNALFMVIDAQHLRTDPADLAALPAPPFRERGTLRLPMEMERLGAVEFTGNFTGFLNAFTTLGRTSTALGTVRTDVTFDRDTVSGVFKLDGRVVTDGFELGRLVNDGTIGPLACDVRLHARGRDFAHAKAGLEGRVPLLTFNDYRITGITVKGDLEKDRFNGMLQCRDPQLDMDFKGLADMRRRLPRRKGRIYDVDFTAEIRHADLRALNIVHRDGWNSLSTTVRARGEIAPDSLKGYVRFENLWYCDASGDHDFGDAELRSSLQAGKPVIELTSAPIDATVRGEFVPTRLPDAFKSVVLSVFPSLADEVRYDHVEQNFDFDLTCKQPQALIDLLQVEMDLAPGARASGWFDSRTFDLSLDAWLPHISYGGFNGDSVRIITDKTLDVLAFSFRSARQRINDSTYVDGIDVTGKAYQDELEVNAAWAGSSHGAAGDLALQGMVNGPRSVEATLLPSRLWFGRGNWRNEKPAELEWDSTVVHVRHLELLNEGQRVVLDGTIGPGKNDALAFELADVRMENLQPYIGDPVLHGRVGGDGRLFALLGDPYLLSYLCVDSMAIGNEAVGDLRFSATWNEADRLIDVGGDLSRDSVKALGFTGRYSPADEGTVDLRLLMDRFDLAFLRTYMPEDLTGLKGWASGSIAIKGPVDDPHIEGSALVQDGGIGIAYLNTYYTFSDRVRVLDDLIMLDHATVTDNEGGTATVGMTLIHDNLDDWSYDVWGTLDHTLCLNTTAKDNELFYGKAYGSGTFNVSGSDDNLEISVDASAERGTRISMPLGGSTEVSAIDFVRFTRPGEDTVGVEGEVDLSGVALDMNVEVTQDAFFELIFDQTVGDVMSGYGQGNLRMLVTPSGEFSMLGRVDVMRGDYLFTLRNIVNKRFEVEQGGSITWYGDPFNATIDLDAVYRMKSPLYDIMPEKLDAYKQRVPVELVLHLDDRLTNPLTSFDVRLPSVDESVRSVVSSAWTIERERNRQIFGLLIMNRFLPTEESGGAGFNVGAAAGTTGAELLSNQVSNFLNQVSSAFDLGFNYRPGDSQVSDEWEIAVGTRALNGDLLITTNLGVQTATTASNGNTYVGDVLLEYLLTNDGRWRAKAFNQSNDQNLNQNDKSQFTQGLGIAYRREFNHFWRDLMRRKVKQSPTPPPVPPPPADGQ